jgi:hypothetical protein
VVEEGSGEGAGPIAKFVRGREEVESDMNTRHQTLCTRHPSAAARRGVLILVVLSMLFLFVLIAITYVLVAMRQLSASRQFGRFATRGEPPQQLLDDAMMQVLRGSANQFSPIYPHSLLESMYGPFSVSGSIAAIDPNGTNATKDSTTQVDVVLEFTANPNPTVTTPGYSISQIQTQLKCDGFLEGCVITMTSGAARGLSSRIVRYEVQTTTGNNPTTTNPVFHVLAFKGDSGAVQPSPNDTFVVNGRAFAGTGFGFDSSRPTTDSNGRPWALLPNAVFAPQLGTAVGSPGGANDDYSAADYKHMALSFTVQNGPQLQTILPSFHRPDLVNYWAQQDKQKLDPNNTGTPDWSKDLALLEQIVLRPNPYDHPNFTGSNQLLSVSNFSKNIAWQFASGATPPWDVDNDGDGIPDSVWLDLGFPIEATSDGRLYKPLFAILCADLDGRLNVNAHSTSEMLSNPNTHTQTVSGPYAGSATNQNLTFPRGQGVGPAEIDFTQAGFSQADLTTLLRGSSSSSPNFEGRYGEGAGSSTAQAGQINTVSKFAQIKRYMYPDPDNSGNYSGQPYPQGPLSSFGSASDLWGRSAIALDFLGQPLTWKPAWTNETLNSPYDIDLSENAPRVGKSNNSGTADNPFTEFELERVLRSLDVDSSVLPSRLWTLAGFPALNQSTSQVRAQMITTDSWDPPSPSIIPPTYLVQAIANSAQLQQLFGNTPPHSVSDLLIARLVAPAPVGGGLSVVQAQSQVRALLAPELIAGLRLNVNRPLGDGRDGNGNGVVDEPMAQAYGNPFDNGTAELATEGTAPASSNWPWQMAFGNAWTSPNNVFNLTNGMNVTGPSSSNPNQTMVTLNDQLLARQLLARHLYILARLMIDDSFLYSANNHWFDLEPAVATDNSPTGKKFDLSVRRIAQWAVNAVAMRSPDNIMIPFEYDKYPFSNLDPTTGQPKDSAHPARTWVVDGILDDGTGTVSPDDSKAWRGLVWGCKGQPLLLTETLAFHDRRVADTNKDPSGKTREDQPLPKTPDPDLDQVRIPEGSLFVELYATHNPYSLQQSGDLYVYNSQSGQWLLDLAKMAPKGNDSSGNSLAYPVWRLAITRPHVGPGNTPSPRTFLDPTQTNPVPESASLDPDQGPGRPNPGSLLHKGLESSPQDVQIERIVWLANTAPTNQIGIGRINSDIFYARKYFNKNFTDTAYLSPGSYAVVGPREVTAIGSQTSTSPTNQGQKWGYPSPQRINLNFTGPTGGITDLTGTLDYPTVGTQIQAPLGIVAAAIPPAAPTANPWSNVANTAKLGPTVPSTGIGLNVSEPLPQSGTYYTEPTTNNPNSETPGYQKMDAYDKLDGTGTGTFIDTPFEKKGRITRPVEQLPTGPETATTFNYRTVFLQRLANPLAPYHPFTNPYLTVDWLPIDLSVFNGEDALRNHSDYTYALPWDPDDPANPNADTPKLLAFASRQRGEYSTHKSNPATFTKENLWSIWPDRTITNGTVDGNGNNLFNLGGENPQYSANDPNAAANNMNFRHVLHSQPGPNNANKNATTLGYLNYSYGDPWATNSTPPAPTNTPAPAPSNYYVGAPFVTDPISGQSLPKPFPWLVASGRPYANPAELMFVGANHPGRQTLEFAFMETTGNVYDSGSRASQRAPFYTELNFFSGSLTGSATPAMNLANVVEYLQTPSPFVNTDTVLNPQTFYWKIPAAGAQVGEINSTANPNGAEPIGTAGLHPPFNFVSNYRDPGRVNINTISSQLAWKAILGGTPGSGGIAGPPFTVVASSRRGFDPAAAATTPYDFSTSTNDTNGPRPSIFSNPFRSPAGANFVPLPPLLAEKPVNVTFLRAQGTKFGGTNIDTSNTPLMAANLPSVANFDYNNYQRNPYFYYQPFGELANKLTTRSNVYAVWVTIGYFEVTPWYGVNAMTGAPNTSGTMTIDPAHPDGYQLGQELGADTGEITRHRGFYIIDRTIPVGFQRGQDLNSDKAVLLKRFIE